ncbi:hypothetical protein AUK40_05555 [Candidatus Wirthbacteria bacterium CG2_30_54_11]|uniref:SSD domain-containing protein n=1 Tax=Candidatus Wirthbacteria bacterium CG2_30_54_11 TaxID=1817892 RepID=A0A1J5IFV6_9BACT|nr:MAG: hypothetical protein AUK40_05555 [Candidatus Wirthbacteria bacterium CG2_30_54_11]
MRIKKDHSGSFFVSIGTFSDRFRYAIITFWLIAAAGVFFLAPQLSDVVTSDPNGILPASAPSNIARDLAEKYFPEQSSNSQAVIVIEAEDAWGLTDAAPAIKSLTAYLTAALDEEVVTKVLSPSDPAYASSLISPDGQVAMLFVGFRVFSDDPGVEESLSIINTQIARLPSTLHGYVTGSAAIISDYSKLALDSVDRTIFITIALVIVILLLIYRAVVAPLVALVSIGLSYIISAGIVAWLSSYGLTVVDFTQTFLIVVLFGVGTDYCLFIISRFREYMGHAEADGRAESRHAIAHVGETITSSAATVVVGMIAMSFASLKLFSNTGPVLAIGVSITLVAGLTLTPALLSVLGTFTFWPSHTREPAKHSPLWASLARFVTSKPFLPLGLGLIVLVPLALWGQGLMQSYDMMADLPAKQSSRQGFAVLSEHFGAGEMQPLEMIAEGIPDAQTPVGLARINELTNRLLSVDGVVDVRSLTLPQGKAQTGTAQMLTIPGQIMSMVDGLSSYSRAQDAPSSAASAFSLPATGFAALRDYFVQVGEAYPTIRDLGEYSATLQSLDSLESEILVRAPDVLLSAQLLAMRLLIGQIPALFESTSGTGLPITELTGQFQTIQGYFTQMVTAYPEVLAMSGYQELMASFETLQQSAMSSLSSQFLLGGGQNLTLTDAQKSLLIQGVAEIGLALDHLVSDVETLLPRAMFIPSDMGEFADTSGLLGALAQPLGSFADVLRALAGEVSVRGIETHFLPLSLLRGSAKEGFDDLIATYSTANGERARFQIVLQDQPYAKASMATASQLRQDFTVSGGYHLSGVSANVLDLRDYLKRDTLQSMALVILGIAVVLVILLRSLVAPLYLMATIILSYSATLGISRLVFEGIFHQDLTWWVPFFMFVLLVALGMDYNIFLMGRVKEEVAKSDNHQGIERAVAQTGSIITSAGLIMAGTFAALMAGSIVGLIQIGFAITVGVLIDTFVIRTTVVPAIASLLDKWNWWPGHGPNSKS